MNDSELLVKLMRERDEIALRLKELDSEKDQLVGEVIKIENQIQIVEAYTQLKRGYEPEEKSSEVIQPINILPIIEEVYPQNSENKSDLLDEPSESKQSLSEVSTKEVTGPAPGFIDLLRNFGG